MKIIIEGIGQADIYDKHFVASGGEAEVYVLNNHAIKIYHEVKNMISFDKIKELNEISSKNVLKPKHIVYDSKNKPIGYAMDFIDNTYPMCKLFTKTFKKNNNISEYDIINLIKEMQTTINNIHSDNCLIVDLNEMNLLSNNNFTIPYFIDVDSYQTPSFKATAIMPSVRDRFSEDFSILTDWFAFAIISFQLYIGIHPYKGNHPKYKNSHGKPAWESRMEDGVSVFDKDVRMPATCNDFSVIPKKHLDWFKDIFVKNNRTVPPELDSFNTMVTPQAHVVIKNDGSFQIQDVVSCPENILSVYEFMGVKYILTKNHIYKDDSKIYDVKRKSSICFSNSEPVICELSDSGIEFLKLNKDLIANSSCRGAMSRNNCIYTVNHNKKLIEHNFLSKGNKIFHKTKIIASVSNLSSHIYKGMIFQDLLNNPYITIPYQQGHCVIVSIPELKNYRIIDGKSEKNFVILLAEKLGLYYKFIFVFDKKMSSYSCRIIDDVSIDSINFVVLDNGICVHIHEDKMELFKDNNKIKEISNCPIDSNMKLFQINNKVHFINDNKILSISLKK